MNSTNMHPVTKPSHKKIKLAVILLVLFIVLVGVFELSRLFLTQSIIEQSVRVGARYATTGIYNQQYCVDLDSDNTPCGGVSKDAEVDIARIPSIKDEVRKYLGSIQYYENVKNTDPDFLKITVCTSSVGYNFIHAKSKEFDNADCAPTENAGLPGDSVIVAIDYNFVFFNLSILGVHPIIIHLTSSHEGIVETFRSSSVVNTPTPINTPIVSSGTPVSSVKEQLAQIDEALNKSMQSSFAFNAPESMKLDDTITIELLLNPSISASDLGNQITESGTVNTGTLEITPRMKAELIAQDPDAFNINQIPENPEQLISSTATTQWKWLLTAKKKGTQTLTLVVYRLVQFQGQDYWREVETYKATINVNVTVGQQVQSIDWKWLAGILVTALLIPAFWRWIDNRKKKASDQSTLQAGRKSKPIAKKESVERKRKTK